MVAFGFGLVRATKNEEEGKEANRDGCRNDRVTDERVCGGGKGVG